ncbi:AraC family transcriptional regulator [Vibrio tapetis]|uniref:Transcriptional regulator, AraC family n=1 Tax=Vibrio tapetis subsp. tapetis TaxID=1671868 RepID=A0A2N8ZJ63_9VIBR|nr:AraC family transcriptional regulator [Vibrio tapetis]SON51945.1 Transcriptional regulator, AraC family [Vibrio tapetis subsp. tapetis]
MLNWIQPPHCPVIAKYVECYWLIEKPEGANSHQFPKLNPDPSAHLILSPSQQAFSYDSKVEISKGSGSHWLYPHHHTLQLDHTHAFVHLGIKFHIGALYSLRRTDDTQPLLDLVKTTSLARILELPSLDNSVSETLINLGRTDKENCRDQLDAILLSWMQEAKEDQHSKLTRKALPLIKTHAISEIGDQLHCSQRTLERSFSRVTGLTLKQCQTMNKLEAILEYLYQHEMRSIDWVDVALQFGFSDQPHLIRQLKKQIGLTPKAYAKQGGLTIDVYGGVSDY